MMDTMVSLVPRPPHPAFVACSTKHWVWRPGIEATPWWQTLSLVDALFKYYPMQAQVGMVHSQMCIIRNRPVTACCSYSGMQCWWEETKSMYVALTQTTPTYHQITIP